LLGPFTKSFGPKETHAWFSSRGVQLKTEPDGRVFPTTDRSQTIKDALETAARDTGVVRIECSRKVKGVTALKNKQFQVKCDDRVDDNSGDCFDRIILATGSSRIGHSIAESLGHTIVAPVPSLFSFKINDVNLTEMSGLSTELCSVRLVIPKKFALENKELVKQNLIPFLTQTGPVLVTHQGLSGPGILKLSAFGAKVMAALQYR